MADRARPCAQGLQRGSNLALFGGRSSLGARRPRTYKAAALAARIAEEPFRTALANVWRAVDLHGVLAHYVANDSLARLVWRRAGPKDYDAG